MGGRGASSGVSDKGKKYGTEYKSLFTVGNIKFIEKTSHDSEMFETRTKGRVYVEVGAKGKPKTIYYFDTTNKKSKSIDLTRQHADLMPHVHHGYMRGEDGKKGASKLTPKEKRMVERVNKLWSEHESK